MATITKYQTNLNCGKCVAAVKPRLDSDSAIESWSVDLSDPRKILTVIGDRATSTTVPQHLAEAGFQVLGALDAGTGPVAEPQRTFWQTYKPLLLVVGYLVGIVAVIEANATAFDPVRAMNHFMGGFFLAFSFFKLLDLRGFVDSFQTYDVLARPVRAYGFAYPFLELGLGVAYLWNFAPIATNVITLAVMLVGIVGVTQALVQKRKIQCVCLGTVFNLPMSKVTFIEDGVMALMAATMLWHLLG